MASEITVSLTLSFTKGAKSETLQDLAAKFDMAGTDFVKATMVTATTPGAAIPQAGVGTPGWFFATNNSTTAGENIKITPEADGSSPCILLEPGESCCCRLAATAPYAFSATGTPELEYMIIED